MKCSYVVREAKNVSPDISLQITHIFFSTFNETDKIPKADIQ